MNSPPSAKVYLLLCCPTTSLHVEGVSAQPAAGADSARFACAAASAAASACRYCKGRALGMLMQE
jgi:hypothetical protein